MAPNEAKRFKGKGKEMGGRRCVSSFGAVAKADLRIQIHPKGAREYTLKHSYEPPCFEEKFHRLRVLMIPYCTPSFVSRAACD